MDTESSHVILQRETQKILDNYVIDKKRSLKERKKRLQPFNKKAALQLQIEQEEIDNFSWCTPDDMPITTSLFHYTHSPEQFKLKNIVEFNKCKKSVNESHLKKKLLRIDRDNERLKKINKSGNKLGINSKDLINCVIKSKSEYVSIESKKFVEMLNKIRKEDTEFKIFPKEWSEDINGVIAPFIVTQRMKCIYGCTESSFNGYCPKKCNIDYETMYNSLPGNRFNRLIKNYDNTNCVKCEIDDCYGDCGKICLKCNSINCNGKKCMEFSIISTKHVAENQFKSDFGSNRIIERRCGILCRDHTYFVVVCPGCTKNSLLGECAYLCSNKNCNGLIYNCGDPYCQQRCADCYKSYCLNCLKNCANKYCPVFICTLCASNNVCSNCVDPTIDDSNTIANVQDITMEENKSIESELQDIYDDIELMDIGNISQDDDNDSNISKIVLNGDDILKNMNGDKDRKDDLNTIITFDDNETQIYVGMDQIDEVYDDEDIDIYSIPPPFSIFD